MLPSHRHDVRIERGSRVAALLGDASAVNSYHHQAVDRIGDGMRAVAHAHDGVVEAIEATNGRFAVGLQWHEEFHTGDSRLAAVFAALVAAARDYPSAP
jgi:gamma-glutamyl-gamma-aminobutyrate hydrolase PuuD